MDLLEEWPDKVIETSILFFFEAIGLCGVLATEDLDAKTENFQLEIHE